MAALGAELRKEKGGSVKGDFNCRVVLVARTTSIRYLLVLSSTYSLNLIHE